MFHIKDEYVAQNYVYIVLQIFRMDQGHMIAGGASCDWSTQVGPGARQLG